METVEILLIEDNPGDVRLTQEAFKMSRIQNRLHAVENGIDALAFLRHEEPYQSAPRPDLILLDLNLPLKGGHEVLDEIKNDNDLKRIPVVVLTTSSDTVDVAESYNLHANCYITKPVGMAQFMKIIQEIENFWFNTVRLPPSSRGS